MKGKPVLDITETVCILLVF